MKFFISAITLTFMLFSGIAFADTTLTRDGEGMKISAPAFATIRSTSIGTKGFACFSTATKIAWELKVVATATTSGAGVGFKMFYNGLETALYDIDDKFFQFQNAPVSKTPNITKVCARGYSTATIKKANFVGQ